MGFKLQKTIDEQGLSGYRIINDETSEVILMGDGYESFDDYILELSMLNKALKAIFG
jgi:hypothetical protein